MIDNILSSEIYQVLEKSLNAASIQHQLISNNIANVDTPGFKRSEVIFQSKLDAIINTADKSYLPLSVTHQKHIPITPNMTIDDIQPEVITKTETSMRNDKNNVDIDSEMTKLAENTAYYSTVAELTSLQLGMLQNVITDGRR